MADWEWTLVDESMQKQIVVAPVLSDSDTSFGGHYTYDLVRPIERWIFEAERAPQSVVNSVKANMQLVKTPFSLEDDLGENYQGLIESFQAVKIKGTARKNVTLTMISPPAVPS